LRLKGFENISYRFIERTDSTQNEALRYYSKNRYRLDNETVYIFTAEEQTHGMGRFQRNWYSPKGGLWMTILSRSAIQAGKIPVFPLGIALAVVGVLEKYGINPLLKWPNDIMVEDKKIAGILATARTEIDLASHIFTGVGINVNNPVPPEIRADATSMREILGKKINLLQLMVDVVEQIIPLYSELDTARIVRQANEILYKKDQKALISLPSGEKIEAVIREIRPNGELAAEVNGKKKTFYAAEIDKP
jgi:BirA family biotin operon repressor/biotin-[acetyl-CoA-carboxylase] ligase